jgi:hypothetical protein
MLDLHPGTGGSNPFPSSKESTNFQSRNGKRPAALARHYRPTVTLVGHRRFAMRQLVALLLTRRWLVGSTLRLTALRSCSWRLLWLALLGSLLLRFAIDDGKHLSPADRYPLSPRIQTVAPRPTAWPLTRAMIGLSHSSIRNSIRLASGIPASHAVRIVDLLLHRRSRSRRLKTLAPPRSGRPRAGRDRRSRRLRCAPALVIAQ